VDDPCAAHVKDTPTNSLALDSTDWLLRGHRLRGLHPGGVTYIGTGAFLLATLPGAFGAIAIKRVAPTTGTLAPTCVALGAGGLLLMLTAAPYWLSYFSHFNLSTLLVTIIIGGAIIFSCLIAVSRIKEAPVEGRGIRP